MAQQELKKIEEAARKLNEGGSMKKLTDSLQKMEPAFMGIGGAGALAFRGIIGAASSFESSMARVRTVTGAVGKDWDDLNRVARESAKDSIYSATEIGDAMYYLGSAGWKTQEIIGGLNGSLVLATATGANLAEATDLTTRAVAMFGLQAKDASKVADILTNTINASQATFQKLAISLPYIGPAAKSLNWSLEETSAALGLLYNKGFEASMAGTGLANSLAQLVKPNKDAVEAMHEMGLSYKQLNPQAQEFGKILDLLGQKHMSYQQAVRIFGLEGAKPMLAMVTEGSAALKEMESQLTKAGSATKAAGMMSQTFEGQVKKMKSALNETGISLGTVVMPTVTKYAEKLTEITKKYNESSEGTKKATVALGELTTGVAGFLLILPTAYRWLKSIKEILPLVGSALTSTTGIWGILITAIAGSFLTIDAAIKKFGLLEEAARKGWGATAKSLANYALHGDKSLRQDTFSGQTKSLLMESKKTGPGGLIITGAWDSPKPATRTQADILRDQFLSGRVNSSQRDAWEDGERTPKTKKQPNNNNTGGGNGGGGGGVDYDAAFDKAKSKAKTTTDQIKGILDSARIKIAGAADQTWKEELARLDDWHTDSLAKLKKMEKSSKDYARDSLLIDQAYNKEKAKIQEDQRLSEFNATRDVRSKMYELTGNYTALSLMQLSEWVTNTKQTLRQLGGEALVQKELPNLQRIYQLQKDKDLKEAGQKELAEHLDKTKEVGLPAAMDEFNQRRGMLSPGSAAMVLPNEWQADAWGQEKEIASKREELWDQHLGRITSINEVIKMSNMSKYDQEIEKENESYQKKQEDLNNWAADMEAAGYSEVEIKAATDQETERMEEEHQINLTNINKQYAEIRGSIFQQGITTMMMTLPAAFANMVAYQKSFKDMVTQLWQQLVYQVVYKLIDNMVQKWLDAMSKMGGGKGKGVGNIIGKALSFIPVVGPILGSLFGEHGGYVAAQNGAYINRIPGFSWNDQVPVMARKGELFIPPELASAFMGLMNFQSSSPSTALSAVSGQSSVTLNFYHYGNVGSQEDKTSLIESVKQAVVEGLTRGGR